VESDRPESDPPIADSSECKEVSKPCLNLGDKAALFSIAASSARTLFSLCAGVIIVGLGVLLQPDISNAARRIREVCVLYLEIQRVPVSLIIVSSSNLKFS